MCDCIILSWKLGGYYHTLTHTYAADGTLTHTYAADGTLTHTYAADGDCVQ